MTKSGRMVYGETTPIRLRRGFSRFLPLGIYSRHYFILLFPIIIILLFMSVVFIERHFAKVTKQMVENILPSIGEIEHHIERAATIDDAMASFQPLMRVHDIAVAPSPGSVPTRDQRVFYDVTGKSIINTVREGLESVMVIDLTGLEDKVALIFLETKFGVMEVAIGRRLLSPTNPHQFLVLMMFVALLSVLISALLLKNQLRPVRQLASAAEAFGRGERVSLNLSGANEIRQATSSFLAMRNRIERHLSQMMTIMTSISHDLKTPLTRLRLGIEVIEDPTKKQAIINDIDVMSRMITEIHDFAMQGEGEDYDDVDPVTIARSAVENAVQIGHDVTIRIDAPDTAAPLLRCRPNALYRSIENLVTNAARYADKVEITVAFDSNIIRYTVEDNGPGIAPEFLNEAKLPFVRLDKARNLDGGEGVGLGLTIADQVAHQHGGLLLLGASERLGGLRASLQIPV